MCVWGWMSPGRTVGLERSMTLKPVGGWAGAAETLMIRSFLMKMSWFLSGAAEVPSMRVPARMMVSASWPWAGCENAISAAQRSIGANFRRGMEISREAGGSLQQDGRNLQGWGVPIWEFAAERTHPPGVLRKNVNLKELCV